MSPPRRKRAPAERAKRVMADAASDLAPVLTALMLALPVVLAGLFFVWSRVVTVRLGYEISKASEVHHRLLEENRGLRIESAALKSPERLEKLAREGYGLVPPRSEQFIRLDQVVLDRSKKGAAEESAPLAQGGESP